MTGATMTTERERVREAQRRLRDEVLAAGICPECGCPLDSHPQSSDHRPAEPPDALGPE